MEDKIYDLITKLYAEIEELRTNNSMHPSSKAKVIKEKRRTIVRLRDIISGCETTKNKDMKTILEQVVKLAEDDAVGKIVIDKKDGKIVINQVEEREPTKEHKHKIIKNTKNCCCNCKGHGKECENGGAYIYCDILADLLDRKDFDETGEMDGCSEFREREIELQDSKTIELRKATEPLIKYLNDNHHPHVHAIVTTNSIEVFEGVVCVSDINDFVKD